MTIPSVAKHGWAASTLPNRNQPRNPMKPQHVSIARAVAPPQGEPGSERRLHPRIHTPPLYVTNASVRDVSLGGICLTHAEPLVTGETESLILTDALSHYTAELTAEVVWAAPGIAGLRWTGLTAGEQSWLRERFTTWIHSPSDLAAQGPAAGAVHRVRPGLRNRRQYERIQNPPLEVAFVAARVQDISLGGICLTLDPEEAIQDRYELFLTGGLYYFSEEITAELVWQKGNRVGLRWANMDEEQRRRLQGYFEQWRDEPLELLMRNCEADLDDRFGATLAGGRP